MEVLPVTEVFDFSINQKELWNFSQDIQKYYSQIILDIQGVMDKQKLLEAITTVIKQHEVLSYNCVENRGSLFPFQASLAASEPDFIDVQVPGIAVTKIEEKINFYLNNPYQPFINAPVRFCLINVSDKQSFLGVRLYALWGDSYSCNFICNEICIKCFNQKSAGDDSETIEYRNFSRWQNDMINDPDQEATAFLEGRDSYLQRNVIPFVNTNNSSFTPGNIPLQHFSTAQYEQLKNTCNSAGITSAELLFSIFNKWLNSFGDNELIVGYIPYSRSYQELDATIGLVAKPLPVRFTEADLTKPLNDLLHDVRKKVEEILLWGDYCQLEKLQNYDRNGGGFFYYCFEEVALSNVALASLPGVCINKTNAYSITSPFLLKLFVVEYGNELTVELYYDENKFTRSDINILAAQLRHHINAYSTNLSESPGLSKVESDIINFANNTAVVSAKNDTILSLFNTQVKCNPNAIAVIFGDWTLTYDELDRRSNQLANYLIQKFRIERGDFVGIMLNRSEWLIIALFGIMKAGAAYVPIDPIYPADRINYILKDSGAKVLISEDELFNEILDKLEIAVLDISGGAVCKNMNSAPPTLYITPNDLAYIIYTSGTTGHPKGTIISHLNLFNYVTWANNYYFSNNQLGNWGFITSISFDLTVTSLYTSLTRGKQLYIGAAQKDAAGLLFESFNNPHIDTLKLTPSHISLLKTIEISETNVGIIICGGEQLTHEHLETIWNIKKSIKVYNEYGPTETTVGSVIKKMEPGDEKILVGKPISNTEIYILGSDNTMAMLGAIGEICISGASLARGYLNKPELTAEKFVEHPFKAGEKLYRTGDEGRWLADGNIEFIGRKDDQVKIRGYRVELSEVTHVLQNQEGVDSAVVVTNENREGEQELVAYIVGIEMLNIADLHFALNSQLAYYMLPSHYVQLDKLPLTANGKMDKKRLPDPERSGISSGRTYVAPRNQVEEKLIDIWKEILQRDNIGVKDNFFELGGHSLKATRLSSKIYKTFEVKINLQELFANVLLEQQAGLIQHSKKIYYMEILPIADQPSYVLSSSQRRLWILSQFEEGSIAYNIAGVYLFEGDLDKEALLYAFNSLIERHEILRTIFKEQEEGVVRQYIQTSTEPGFEICYQDLRGEQQQEDQVRELIRKDRIRPFDLSAGPLLRASVYQIQDNKWIFTYVMHHIISDGWSMEVLIKELLSFYNSYIAVKDNDLAPLRIQYRDYAAWQQEQLSSATLQVHKQYWLKQFSGELPVLELPGNKIRPAVKTYNGSFVSKVISEEVSNGLKALNQDEGTTLFMGLLAGVNVLLYKYTDQQDIILGSPIAGREHVDLEDQIGFYINTLALRTRFKGSNSFKDLLQKVREVTLGAYEHQVYPFDELVNDLSLRRDMSRHPLFDIVVVLQNAEPSQAPAGPTLSRLKVSSYGRGTGVISKFDLTFNFIEVGDRLHVQIEYNSDIYNRSAIERLSNHFEELLKQLVATPAVALSRIDYLSALEQQQLLSVFNNTAVPYPRDQTVITRFEAQVASTPDHTALVYEGRSLSYRQINEAANQLGAYLRKTYAIQPDELICILQPYSEWLVISILGVLKSGGAYVPVDPGYPQERIVYMVSDSHCKVLLDEGELKQFLAQRDIYEKENITHVNKPEDLAYVIYTSGSTGNPKGVMVEHRSLLNLCYWHIHSFSVTSQDRSTLYAGVAFDAAVWELFPYLLSGSGLYMIGESLRLDVELLSAYYEANNISISFLPTQVGEQFLGVRNSSLRCLLVGGDKLNTFTPQSYRVINNYGPTEATVVATSGEVLQGDSNISIGKPISNIQLYVLNESGSLLPIGLTGELYIGGESVARGYLNRPDLTAEKFVDNPFKAGERIYRTGDYGRWLDDGRLLFMGRKDDQVKIRGYRIELGEVESLLQGLAGIESAVVVARSKGDGDKELVAYIVSKETPDIAAIHATLKSRLPGYMLPAHYVALESLPLTANGKVDRKHLPEAAAGVIGLTEYVAPRNEVEAQLVRIWEEILQRTAIGIKDNFFDLGGHSLKAISMVNKIKKNWSITFTIKEVFQKPHIEHLAKEIQKKIWVSKSVAKTTMEDRTETVRL